LLCSVVLLHVLLLLLGSHLLVCHLLLVGELLLLSHWLPSVRGASRVLTRLLSVPRLLRVLLGVLLLGILDLSRLLLRVLRITRLLLLRWISSLLLGRSRVGGNGLLSVGWGSLLLLLRIGLLRRSRRLASSSYRNNNVRPCCHLGLNWNPSVLHSHVAPVGLGVVLSVSWVPISVLKG